jgi:hypothetical protein
MTEMHSLNLRNELTFELAMVAMVLVDKNGAIEAWNKQAADTFQVQMQPIPHHPPPLHKPGPHLCLSVCSTLPRRCVGVAST